MEKAGRRAGRNSSRDYVQGEVLLALDKGSRTEKGEGFADPETGIFRELGIICETTPLATTVNASQLVDNSRVFRMTHNSPLDFVATEKALIVTGITMPRPLGVARDFVQEDQFETITIPSSLRDRMLGEKAVGR